MVYEQLEEAIAQTGVPRHIVSDGGPDLRKGIRLFCQAHTETIRTYDIKHATARILQHHLEADEAWPMFQQSAASTKRQVQQTRLAFVAPRNQRSKARYMNAGELIRWGQQARDLLSATRSYRHARTDLLDKIGWVEEFRHALQTWNEWLACIHLTEQFVRIEGFHYGASRELLHRFSRLPLSAASSPLQSALVQVVARERVRWRAHQNALLAVRKCWNQSLASLNRSRANRREVD